MTLFGCENDDGFKTKKGGVNTALESFLVLGLEQAQDGLSRLRSQRQRVNRQLLSGLQGQIVGRLFVHIGKNR